MEYIECIHYKMNLETFTQEDLHKILLFESTLTQEEDMLEALPVYLSYFEQGGETYPFEWRFSYSRISNQIDFYLHRAYLTEECVITLIPLITGITVNLVGKNLSVEFWYDGTKIKTNFYDKEELDAIFNPVEEGEDIDEKEDGSDDGSSSEREEYDN